MDSFKAELKLWNEENVRISIDTINLFQQIPQIVAVISTGGAHY